MADPFATAAAALFASPLAVAAVFTPVGGEAVETRVIRRGPDRSARYGDVQIYGATHVIDVARSDIMEPQVGDQFLVGGLLLSIMVEPVLDVEGLTWTCGCEVAG